METQTAPKAPQAPTLAAEVRLLKLVQQLHIVGAILLTAVLMFILMALLSYHSMDSGWSYTGAASQQTQNLGGALGALMADLLLSSLGVVAYALPLALIWHVWKIVLKTASDDIGLVLAEGALRLVGAVLLIVASTGLIALRFTHVATELPFSLGGILGGSVMTAFEGLLGFVGGGLMMTALAIAGLTLYAQIQWLQVMDAIGACLMRASERGADEEPMEMPYAPEPLPYDSNDHDEIQPATDTPSLMNRLLASAESVLPDLPSVSSPEPTTRIEPSFDESLASSPVAFTPSQPPSHEITEEQYPPDSTPEDTLNFIPPPELKNVNNKPTALQAEQVDTSLEEQGIQRPVETPKPVVPPPKVLTPKPCLSLLELAQPTESGYTEESLRAMGDLLEVKLKEFGIQVEVISIMPGPVVTQFELSLAPGVKASKITNLARDLARSLSVMSVRVVEVIPGKPYVGIEIPNQTREMVRLSQVLSDESFQTAKSRLALALGHDIGGTPVIADLAKMPHLLVAGTTGSGKSVGVNVMLLSLLFKSTPDEVRLILVDPKMLELSVYEGIPHLLAPVITDMNEAANGLRWCVGEMERRYKLMAALGVRNLAGFNQKIEQARAEGNPILDPLWVAEEQGNIGVEFPMAPPLDTLPSIVVVIDEFADMMMIVGKKVEQLIARIAQKARAAGIHLILATQRPSVDVITGLIKANIPTRMAFQVSSKIDSRTIIDQGGAEQLLGHGDMLYVPPGTSMPIRVHGAFVDDHEVHNVVNDWKQRGQPDYLEGILDDSVNSIAVPGLEAEGDGAEDGESEPLYDEAVAFVIESRKASISAVQRKLRIGYNRAARLIETMEAAGVVSAAGHNGLREVLVPKP